jgi:hypothetical protein
MFQIKVMAQKEQININYIGNNLYMIQNSTLRIQAFLYNPKNREMYEDPAVGGKTSSKIYEQ